MTFKELDLIEPILKALEQTGYTTPTPIQEQAIPVLLKGKDLLGCAQTGTGKTAAFAIPIIQRLYQSDSKKGIKALILTPTRELAIQIGESFDAYARYTRVKHTVIFGGVPPKPQIDALKRGVQVLIATPGRLLDLQAQGYISLKGLDYFVLDEADRMLDMGFIHDIKRVLKLIPDKRQTLFFSATMPPEIEKLANSILTSPEKVEVTPVSSTVDTIQQSVYFVEKNEKKDLLLYLLKDKSIESVLIFTRTKYGADKLAKILNKNSVVAEAIHGNKSQNARQRALNNFKDRSTRVLIATDIAARGIDVNLLSHVINYELPNISETYVHRIGRTGRAGKTGAAYNILSGRKQEMEMREISRYTKADITEIPVPTSKELRSAAVAETRAKLLELAAAPASEEALTVAQELLAQTESPEQLLAALIQQQLDDATKNLPAFDVPKPIRKGKRAGAKTVRVHINAGRKDRMAPNFILGALVEATGMAGNEFGKIDIHDQYTTVEVPETETDFVIDSMQNEKINGKSVAVRRYEERDNDYRGDSRGRGGRNGGQHRQSRHGYNQRARSGGYNRKRRKG